MAKYKNREVLIIREIPHSEGDQVVIEHLELPGQRETVPMSQVVVSKDEMEAQKKRREEQKKLAGDVNPNDYRVEGVNDEASALMPTYKDVIAQRAAEDAVVRAEEQKAKQAEWEKAHPKAPAGAYQQLEAVKVVPYKEQTEKALKNQQAKK